MGISTFDENLDIISALPTCPAAPEYTADEIKSKFDEGGKKIKEYINSTLIPQILDEISNTSLGDGAYRYIPCKVLLKQYTSAGEYNFNTKEYPSFTGLYDIVLVGGGGGGYNGSAKYGGGGGAVTQLIGQALDGSYTVCIGAGGTTGTDFLAHDGETSYITNNGEDMELYVYASGGEGADASTPCARGGGIGATDAVCDTDSLVYGKGGDSIGYGIGAKGASIDDSIKPPAGYGGGGWGPVSGKCGTVLIYGYVRQEV